MQINDNKIKEIGNIPPLTPGNVINKIQTLVGTSELEKVDGIGELVDKADANQKKINPIKGTISLCCIVKNEAKNIYDFLKCWGPFVDEICMVDTGSNDETIGWAKKYCIEKNITLRIEYFEWCDDFAAARNVSLEMAEMEWLLWSDADDRIKPEAANLMRTTVVQFDNSAGGIVFNVSSKVSDNHVDEVAQLRLFKKSLGLKFEGKVHEYLTQKDGSKNIYLPKLVISHIGYLDPELLKIKRERNNRIIEANLDKPIMLYFYAKKFDSVQDPWSAMGVYLWCLKKEGVSEELKSEICYCIGRIFIRMKLWKVAIEWLEQSKEMDSRFYLAGCYDELDDFQEAKGFYSQYILIAENGIPTFGSLRKQLMPKALERLQKISAHEANHWKNFKLQ